ncbi:MAG: hypothetical protein JWO74_2697 [Solirubrobacterales bacterium]|jgi:hypothetical protein|nr:hypothetical protein [Solirubrobacterales bacterium]
MRSIDLRPPDDETGRLWASVADLTELLPLDWVLIGGLMVQIHAFERGVEDVRVTTDVDVLGQARPQGPLRAIDQALRADGFQPEPPDLDGYAFRYSRDGLIVDVLAPDGVKPPPALGTGQTAIGVPGGSQALVRQEEITIRLGARTFRLRRPSLLGAILIKARSLVVHHDPDSQREDLLLLLSLVDDPRAMAGELKKSERRWLRDAEARLSFDRPASVGATRLRLARLTLALLLGES